MKKRAEAKAALERTLAASDELPVYRESIQKAREVKPLDKQSQARQSTRPDKAV